MDCDAYADEMIDFLNGPIDGLEIPLSEAVSEEGDIELVIYVRIDAILTARYIYAEKESRYLYVDMVDVYAINSGKVINSKDWC